MAGRAVKPGQTELDPMFFIPDGVDELSYSDDASTDMLAASDDFDDFDDDSDIQSDAADDITDYSGTPDTPQILSVVAPQTIRKDLIGNEVVDVIFNVEDIAGVTSYEIRVSAV